MILKDNITSKILIEGTKEDCIYYIREHYIKKPYRQAFDDHIHDDYNFGFCLIIFGLKAIEDEGKKPVIKGLIWHQGESDAGNNNYQTQMEALINDFRTDYADYATDEDGKNIAFLDCTIYDGSKNTYGSQDNVNKGINAKKNAIAAKGQLDKDDENYEPNFIVDGTFTDHGLKLEIGDEAKGGFNVYHYNTKDAFILGEAYADIILENNLLD